ncbi:hypothetical protein [Streptomyces sp. NPDC057740]|uniref:hypothetical protein n=1 Tax=Streptomyces sp. NPDC057740 TaxID=3346234 RepID=UPI003687EAA5
MTADLRPVHPDRLEPGEGARWTGSGVALVDRHAVGSVGAGRTPAHPGPTPRPVDPVIGRPVHVEGGVLIAVRGAGVVRRPREDGSLDRALRLPARRLAGVCLAHGVPYVTTARVGEAVPGPGDGALFTARVGVPGTPTPVCRLDAARHSSSVGVPA